MGTSGLEPPTSRLSGVRSNHLSYAPVSFFGGDEEDRTPDPLLAKQVLSQLSYTPAFEKSLELFFFPGLSPHFKLPFQVPSKSNNAFFNVLV